MTQARSRYVDRRREIQIQLREIDAIVRQMEAQQDIEVRGHLSRFAVIRLSGLLEYCLELMIVGFLEEHSSGKVLAYASAQAWRISNLNPDKLESLVGQFDDDWRQDLHRFLEVDERRQTLGNLIGARHTLAHGKSTSVSTALLHTYHDVAVQAIEILLDLFIPLPKPRSTSNSRDLAPL
jgi:hypothetical protein